MTFGQLPNPRLQRTPLRAPLSRKPLAVWESLSAVTPRLRIVRSVSLALAVAILGCRRAPTLDREKVEALLRDWNFEQAGAGVPVFDWDSATKTMKPRTGTCRRKIMHVDGVSVDPGGVTAVADFTWALKDVPPQKCAMLAVGAHYGDPQHSKAYFRLCDDGWLLEGKREW